MIKVERRVKWKLGFFRYGQSWTFRIGELGFYWDGTWWERLVCRHSWVSMHHSYYCKRCGKVDKEY